MNDLVFFLAYMLIVSCVFQMFVKIVVYSFFIYRILAYVLSNERRLTSLLTYLLIFNLKVLPCEFKQL